MPRSAPLSGPRCEWLPAATGPHYATRLLPDARLHDCKQQAAVIEVRQHHIVLFGLLRDGWYFELQKSRDWFKQALSTGLLGKSVTPEAAQLWEALCATGAALGCGEIQLAAHCFKSLGTGLGSAERMAKRLQQWVPQGYALWHQAQSGYKASPSRVLCLQFAVVDRFEKPCLAMKAQGWTACSEEEAARIQAGAAEEDDIEDD